MEQCDDPPNIEEKPVSISKANLTILAINPFNYRTVVSYNFDKFENQQFWDKRILKYNSLIIKTTSIHESFIGIRVNVNENDEFMIKLNVSSINFIAINNFYNISSEFIKLKSFYYELKNDIIHFAGDKKIPILINNFKILISPNSFIQANHIMGNKLYENIANLVKPNKNVIIYGRNSFHIATQIYNKFKVIKCLNPCKIAYNDGLEIILENKFNWETINTKESLYQEINNIIDDSTTIIISPGRSGYYYFDMIDLSKLKNKQIFYITCNEESLKKDIKDNFIITNNIMIELFPGTIYNEHIIQLSI